MVLAALAAAVSLRAEDNKGWQTSATVNVAVNKGNSDTLLAGGNLLGLKKWDKNELSAGLDAVYGSNKDQTTGVRTTTAQNYGASLQYNRLIDDRGAFLNQ